MNDPVKIIFCEDQDLLRVIGDEIGFDPAENSEKLTDNVFQDYLEKNSYFPNFLICEGKWKSRST